MYAIRKKTSIFTCTHMCILSMQQHHYHNTPAATIRFIINIQHNNHQFIIMFLSRNQGMHANAHFKHFLNELRLRRLTDTNLRSSHEPVLLRFDAVDE